jgi:hypothetical protein
MIDAASAASILERMGNRFHTAYIERGELLERRDPAWTVRLLAAS